MPRLSSAGSLVTPGLVHPDPGIVEQRSERIGLERGVGPAAEQPAMRAGHDNCPDLLGADQRGRVERPHDGRLGDQQEGGFQSRGRLAQARAGLLQRRRGVSAGHAGAAAERDRGRVRVSDDAARHHVGPVSDARGIMPDGGSWYAEPGQVIEPGNAGLVPSHPGIVEDSCRNAQLCRDIGGINAAVRTVDDNRSCRRRFQHG